MFACRTVTSRTAIAVAFLCSVGVFAVAPSANVSANTNFVTESDVSDKQDSTKEKKSKPPRTRMISEGTKLGMMFLPSLKVRSPIVEGVTDPMFDLGMGHWPGTAMPGERGNAVYGGHRTAGPAPLYHVDKLKKGDSIIILRGLKRYHYKVTTTFVVKPTAVWITRQSSKSTLTLFSCHPLHSTKRRYIVQASLVK